MRQTTLPEQTAKLIELGFDRPKNRVIKQLLDRSTDSWITIGEEGDYSIGELIEMLPKIYPKITTPYCFEIGFDTNNYIVGYTYDNGYIEVTSAVELVDALYDMVVKLKEEGVI